MKSTFAAGHSIHASANGFRIATWHLQTDRNCTIVSNNYPPISSATFDISRDYGSHSSSSCAAFFFVFFVVVFRFFFAGCSGSTSSSSDDRGAIKLLLLLLLLECALAVSPMNAVFFSCFCFFARSGAASSSSERSEISMSSLLCSRRRARC